MHLSNFTHNAINEHEVVYTEGLVLAVIILSSLSVISAVNFKDEDGHFPTGVESAMQMNIEKHSDGSYYNRGLMTSEYVNNYYYYDECSWTTGNGE